MIEQWCPNCQDYTECTNKSYPIKGNIKGYKVWRVETICVKCKLTISTLTKKQLEALK